MTLPSLNNVEGFLTEPDYFNLLINQLAKDFANEEFSNQVFETTVSNPERLEELVLQFLDYLFKQNQEEFMQLMYKIDIPDADFKRILGSESFLLDLAQLVIKRELLKVVIRKKYDPNA